MERVKNFLVRTYNYSADQESDWRFFLGLAEYFKYVEETPATMKIVSNAVEQYNKLKEKLNEQENAAVAELNNIKTKLLSKIDKNKISYDSLNQELAHLKKFEAGLIATSASKPEALYGMLFDIARNLTENKHKEILTEFIDEKRDPQNIFVNFRKSENLDKFLQEEEKLKNKGKIEIWGVWLRLREAYLVIFKCDEIQAELEKEKHNSLNATGFWIMRNEMKKLRDISEGKASKFNSDIHYFKRADYNHYFFTFHNHLLKEIDNIQKEPDDITPIIDLKKITHITIVQGNQKNKNRIVINKNYTESFEVVDGTSKNIKALVDAIIDKTDNLKNINDLEACKTYLNSNSGCRIYKNKHGKQIYTITPIVKFNNSLIFNKELEILPSITTNVITYTKFKSLLSGQKSRNETKKT